MRGLRGVHMSMCMHMHMYMYLHVLCCVLKGWRSACAACHARLVRCRICVVSGARRQGRSAEHAG